MSEKITLYHGTSFDVIGGKVLGGKEPLIGKRWLSDPGWSGSLTDNKNLATRWAYRRGGDPMVLTYNLPQSMLIDEGVVGMHALSRGFVTTLEVGLAELSSSYFQALLFFNHLSTDTVKMQVKKRELSFHAVPFQYLVSHENV